tara:strand:+ start:30776 stop:31171 length:396 start_codon:yes stop_codon:yes gene_type:complete
MHTQIEDINKQIKEINTIIGDSPKLTKDEWHKLRLRHGCVRDPHPLEAKLDLLTERRRELGIKVENQRIIDEEAARIEDENRTRRQEHTQKMIHRQRMNEIEDRIPTYIDGIYWQEHPDHIDDWYDFDEYD